MSEYTVVATDRVARAGLAPLMGDPRFEVRVVENSSDDEFARQLVGASGLIVRSTTMVTHAMLDMAPELRVVGRAGVGIDNIDLAEATKRGIAVLNAPDGNTVSAAELTVALMLSSARRVTAADRSIRAGRWDRAKFRGMELRGKVLGLIGAGRIGVEVAARSRAFGMSVIAHDPFLTNERAADVGIDLVEFDGVLQRADMLSLHVPLTDRTRGMISHDALAMMKESAFVINASRGGVVDEQALVEALVSGSIAGAALDVFSSEPIAEGSPLLEAPNLVLTPHLGASTAEAQVQVALDVAEGIRAVLGDGDASGAVNAAEIALT